MRKDEWVPNIGTLVEIKSIDEIFKEFSSLAKLTVFEVELGSNGQPEAVIWNPVRYDGSVDLQAHSWSSLIETPAEVVRGRYAASRARPDGTRGLRVITTKDSYAQPDIFRPRRGGSYAVVSHWASGKHLLVPRPLLKPYGEPRPEPVQTPET